MLTRQEVEILRDPIADSLDRIAFGLASIGKSLSGDRPAETARELEHPSPSIAPAPAVDEDEGLLCGNCGQRTTFSQRENWSVDYETGYVQGKWLVCDNCGAETDQDEVDGWNKANG